MYSLYNNAAVKIKYENVTHSTCLSLTTLKLTKTTSYTKNALINIGGRIRAGKLFSFSYGSSTVILLCG